MSVNLKMSGLTHRKWSFLTSLVGRHYANLFDYFQLLIVGILILCFLCFLEENLLFIIFMSFNVRFYPLDVNCKQAPYGAEEFYRTIWIHLLIINGFVQRNLNLPGNNLNLELYSSTFCPTVKLVGRICMSCHFLTRSLYNLALSYDNVLHLSS